jgi:signal transduction histidine kinase
VALFRIFQEALSNVAKHSGAERVEVRLEATETDVRLCVRDDGEGFTVDAGTQPGAFGLRGMEERARLIGAELSVTSAPGHGTEVLVRLAVPEASGDGGAAAAPATATA